jgi:hypothetical protein
MHTEVAGHFATGWENGIRKDKPGNMKKDTLLCS